MLPFALLLNLTYIDYKVEVRPRDTLSAGCGWGVIGTLSATTRSTTFRAIPCLRAAGVEVLE
jgi:hypothetical protein